VEHHDEVFSLTPMFHDNFFEPRVELFLLNLGTVALLFLQHLSFLPLSHRTMY